QQRRAVRRPARQQPARQQARSPSRPAAPSPEAEAQAIQAVEKAPDAKRVLVVGDFMARALARGLGEAYEEDPNVVVIEASSGSSGLVRDDYYNWRAELPKIVEEQKPDTLVVMIGANDRQAMQTASGPAQHGTDAWKEAYGKRIAEFLDVLKATGKPVLWAGLVPVRSSTMSRDYSSLNGLYRENMQGAGVTFIDAWNGFADEAGGYVESGPDVQGQVTRLRVDDGLNFTRAGQRKLAFFVESDLARILKDGAPAQVARLPDESQEAEDVDEAAISEADGDEKPAIAGEDSPAAAPPRRQAAAPRIGPMVPLDAIDMPSGQPRLSGGGGASGAVIDAVVAQESGVAERGGMAPAGRADNFAWPGN
ncbi:MAG TPA: SGNH family hydrolase, partial [Afifellaceae bacterium]|nr:SGNH family hydrolase [Afifellaceae bacterium]